MKHEERWFVWEGCYVNHKEDGSLILFYYYDGDWHMNTRGSFGQGEAVQGMMTWRELFNLAVPQLDAIKQDKDNRAFTWVFELCSQYNKVVRHYDKPCAYLLSAYNGMHELMPNVVDELAFAYGLDRPKVVQCRDIFDCTMYIAKLDETDKTFEGVVIRDINNQRWKVKNPSYIALHRLADNGNLPTTKRLLPLVLNGEIDEVVRYFPEIEPNLLKLKAELQREWQNVDNIWFCHHDQKSQKKFAETVLKETRFSHILFEARKKGVHPKELWDYEHLIRFFE